MFNISANAQYVSEATADVYQRPAVILTIAGVAIDFSDSAPEIVMSFGDAATAASAPSPYSHANVRFTRANPGDGDGLQADLNTIGPNGLFLYPVGGQEMRASDRFFISDAVNNLATVFAYTTGGELALAENTGNPAATTGTGEFFLNTVSWTETDDITAAGGFTPVQCAAGFVSDNMVNCRDIAAADCGQNGRPDFWDGSMCVADCGAGFTNPAVGETCRAEVQDPQTGNNNPQPQKSDGKNHTGALIFGGLMIMGAIGYAIDGDVSPFNFAPDFGYSATESGYSANAGGRMDFRKDNWHLYQSADSDFHRNGSLEFRYTSGGKYKGDIWAAAFSESVQGETADYDFSLSANLQGGIWKISPVYRLHSEYEDGETETQNTLNLEGILRINRWTINPSAGFRWENADDFAENARFRIDAVHRF